MEKIDLYLAKIISVNIVDEVELHYCYTVQREIFGRVKFSDNLETASVTENLTFENLSLNRLSSTV